MLSKFARKRDSVKVTFKTLKKPKLGPWLSKHIPHTHEDLSFDPQNP